MLSHAAANYCPLTLSKAAGILVLCVCAAHSLTHRLPSRLSLFARATAKVRVLLQLRQRDGGCHGGAIVERVVGRKAVAGRQVQTGVDGLRQACWK